MHYSEEKNALWLDWLPAPFIQVIQHYSMLKLNLLIKDFKLASLRFGLLRDEMQTLYQYFYCFTAEEIVGIS